MATNKNFIVKNGLDVSGTANLSTLNLTGSLTGPATFTIDPAAIGDNTGTVVIAGNLQVDGTQTTINSTTMTVDDLNLTLASGAANASAANGAGLTVDGASATLTYNSTGDNWAFNKNVDVTGLTSSGPINLTAGALAAAGNAGLSHRSTDNKVYLQAGTGGFNILDDQQNTHFSIDSAGESTFNGNVGIGIAPDWPLDLAGSQTSVQFQLGRTTNSTGTTWMGADSTGFHLGTGTYSSGGFTFANPALKVLATTGNVGIGIATPGRKLHVKDSGQIKLENTTTTTWAGLDIHTSVGTNDYDMYMGMLDSNGRFFIDVNSNGEDITILQNSNVGIGETNPVAKLAIKGANDTNFEIQPDISSGVNRITNFNRVTSAYKKLRVDASEHEFYISGNPKVNIDTSGNVGINHGLGGGAMNSKLNVFADGEAFRVDGSSNTSRTIRFRNTGTNGSSNAIIESDGSLQLKNADANAAIYMNSVRDIEFQTTSGNGTAGHMRFSSYNTQIMHIDGASNRVGIGINSSLLGTLHVAGAVASATHGGIIFVRNTGATSSNTTFGGIHFSSSPGTDYSIGKYNVNTSTYLQFRNGNNGTGLMSLASDGTLILSPVGVTTGLQLQGRSSDNNFFIQFNTHAGGSNKASIGTDTVNDTLQYGANNHKFVNQATNATAMSFPATNVPRVHVGSGNQNAATGKRGIRVGRTMYNWFNYGRNDGHTYLHIKTNLLNTWQNLEPTMSMLHIKGYTYSGENIDSMLGFHNWNGTFHNKAYTNNGTRTVVSSSYAPYLSSDNYCVIVLNIGNNYPGISIDWHQAFDPYSFQDIDVLAYTKNANASGVY